MPSKTIRKIACPKCGQEGVLIVKRIKGRECLYVKHRGNKWCYIGPADSVNITSQAAVQEEKSTKISKIMMSRRQVLAVMAVVVLLVAILVMLVPLAFLPVV